MDDADLKESVTDQIVLAMTYALNNEFKIGLFDETTVDLYVPARLDFDHLVLELARKNLMPVQFNPNGLLSLNNGQKPFAFSLVSPGAFRAEPVEKALQPAGACGIHGNGICPLSKILSVFNSLKLLKQVEAVPSESTAIVKRERFPFEHLIPEIGNSGLSSKLETFHNPSSFISEQFKTLKVRLAKRRHRHLFRVIAVSSPHTETGNRSSAQILQFRLPEIRAGAWLWSIAT